MNFIVFTKHVLKMMRLIYFLIFFLSLHTTPVFASCNNVLPAKNNATIHNVACTIATIDGVDNATQELSITNTGTLTITGGASLTINNTGKLVLGALNLINGSIAIETGGAIIAGPPLYITDTDADGWPANTMLYVATASGRRRLGLMRSLTIPDCNDSNDYRTDNQCCAAITRYRDSDGDGYGNPSISQSLCPTAGWVTNNTDCYDGNSNARPGSTTCSSIHRGDGSFDYNCSNTNTYCGADYYADSYVTELKCVKSNFYCVANRYWHCAINRIGCGASGYQRMAPPYNIGHYGTNPVSAPGENCCFNPAYSCTLIGTAGTQSCQ
jgi:hypothetical protein